MEENRPPEIRSEKGLSMALKQKIMKFLQYFAIFLVVVPLGTLLHEVGHWIVAVASGFEARIAYAYTISSIYFEGSELMYFYFILGGPLVTWVQSLIPFLMLVFHYRKKMGSVIEGQLPSIWITSRWV